MEESNIIAVVHISFMNFQNLSSFKHLKFQSRLWVHLRKNFNSFLPWWRKAQWTNFWYLVMIKYGIEIIFFFFLLQMHVLKFEIFRIMKVLKMIACKLLEWILEPSLGSSDWLRIVKNRFWRFEGQIHCEWDFFFLREVQNDFQVASYIMQSNKLQVGGHPAWVQTYLTWGSALEIASS